MDILCRHNIFISIITTLLVLAFIVVCISDIILINSYRFKRKWKYIIKNNKEYNKSILKKKRKLKGADSMCNNCKGELKLVSYKWNEEKLIYKYKCDNCDKMHVITKERNDEELKELIFNNNLYDNL